MLFSTTYCVAPSGRLSQKAVQPMWWRRRDAKRWLGVRDRILVCGLRWAKCVHPAKDVNANAVGINWRNVELEHAGGNFFLFAEFHGDFFHFQLTSRGRGKGKPVADVANHRVAMYDLPLLAF